MTEEYVVWKHDIVPNACSLFHFEGFEKAYLLERGNSLSDQFPDDAYFDMNPDRPNDTLLVDSLYNNHSQLILSEPFVAFLSEKKRDNLEFLPVKIMNHKGKFADEKYFIMNVLDHQDCLDVQASGAKLPRMKTGSIQRVKKVVLDEDKLDDSLDIFRITSFHRANIVKKSLADEITAQGFTGVKWVSLDKFNGRI